jgi:hypothetical protein
MDQQIAGQLGIGALCLVVGASGWFLPYRWNLLRLRRGLDRLLSRNVNEAIPKVIGTILVLVGIGILVGTGMVGKFK